ncbi:MAG: alpha/beta hydrolase domain-containing protein [Thermomicrobiales bacterium]
MAVTGLEITSRAPYQGGMTFGEVGAYERIDGLIHFAVDPTHPANAAIVDLDKAARDAAGRVTFSADFCLLQPADPARANRRLIFDVLNRGGKRAVPRMNHVPPALAQNPDIHPGDGFLFRRGWSVVHCGWQWDVLRGEALLGLNAPEALRPDGSPIAGTVRVWFQPNALERHKLLADRMHQPYNAAALDQPDALLRVRDWADGPPSVIPRDRWRFAHDDNGAPVPDDGYIWMAEGFTPGKVYEVIYRTRRCPVVGAGMLAVRDCVAFLQHSDAAENPCAGRIETTIAYGVSQSGRFLRHFLYTGLNVDEAGRQVFDGLLIHVAGARRGEFNHRYAQPSDQQQPSFGHLLPFSDDPQTDPITGQTAGLLDRQRALGGVPKIVYTNTAAEYWRGDTSLMHTDMAGTRDVEPPATSRVYLFASTQHIAGALPLVDSSGPGELRGRYRFNAVDYAPLMRAALVNLERWITEGMELPASVFPRRADGTAITGAEAIASFKKVPGPALPDPARLPIIRRVGLGPDAADGIGRYPTEPGERYPNYVAAVDADGNEVGGIRMPDVSVPLATYTGWNPRHPETGGAGQILPMQGATHPFPRTADDRVRTGDPRPAIAERYRDRDDYLDQVRHVALTLVEQRYLLPEDVSLAVEIAAERYDYFMGNR